MVHLLAAVTSADTGSHSPIGDALVGIVFILVGSLNAAKPDLGYRTNRWQLRNKARREPPRGAVMTIRIVGVLMVIVGIVLLVVDAVVS